MARYSAAIKYVSRKNGIVCRCVVVNMDCILYVHRPYGGIDAVFSMYAGMKYHGTRQVGDCLCGTFCNTILTVGIGAAETQTLMRHINELDKFSGFESATISQIVLDYDTMDQGKLFIALFGTNSFNCRKTNLIHDLYVSITMIHKDTPTNVLCGGWFSI
jgi:hypothetical protein